MRSLVILSAAFAAALACAPAAEAQQRVRVSHADLDLSKESDARVMLRRIERAAERACSPAASQFSTPDPNSLDSCKSEAMNRAVSALSAPMVTARFVEKNGREIRVASAQR